MTALTERLAALVAEDEVFVAGARVIAQDGGQVALTAILREIDSTVLERTLEFALGDVTVSAIVSGRRLKGLIDVAGGAPDATAVLGQSLSREEPDVLKAAGDLLAQLCAAATSVSVCALPYQKFGSGGDAGVSATGLADLWQVDPDAEPLPPIARFIAANGAQFTAYLVLSGDKVADKTGKTKALQKIWDEQVPSLRESKSAMSGKQGGPQLMCFEGATGAGTTIAFAVVGDDACLCAFASDQLAAVTRSWLAIIR